MENLIKQAVELMHRRYDEPLTLDDMANAAVMSKFHFIRTFREHIGVTPGRFLGALRIQKSKHLLRTTALNVSDVAVCVGYCSTGSFTRRFSDSVGCSPIHYRAKMTKSRFAVNRAAEASEYADGGVISGKLLAPAPVAGFRIGVFDTPIAEGKPAALAEADDSGHFTLGPVWAGEWYVHAVGLDPWADEPAANHPAPLMVGRSEVLVVPAAGHVTTEIEVHPAGWNDLPVLFAPLDPDPRPHYAEAELLAS